MLSLCCVSFQPLKSTFVEFIKWHDTHTHTKPDFGLLSYFFPFQISVHFTGHANKIFALSFICNRLLHCIEVIRYIFFHLHPKYISKDFKQREDARSCTRFKIHSQFDDLTSKHITNNEKRAQTPKIKTSNDLVK